MGSTDFNLEHAITRHVQMIKAEGSTTNSDDAELTAHLYDACEDLVRKGLTEEEAFMVARNRLGDMDLLVEEYGKVNTTVSTNKIWAYMLLGAGLLDGVFKMLLLLGGYFYLTIYTNFGTTTPAIAAVTIFNLLLVASVWYTVRMKHVIYQTLEDSISKKPIRTVFLSFLPSLSTLLIPVKLKAEIYAALNFPVYKFNSDLAAFSLYLLMFSLAAGLLSLVFSLKKTESISLKSLFEKPSAIFLLIFGLLIELFAASTRGIRIESIVGSGFVFGLVFFTGSYLISYYNPRKDLMKNLFIFSSIGLILEISVGIVADAARGNTNFTVYFTVGLLIGVLSGAVFGNRMRATPFAD